jgi:hypothetical protein
MSSEGYIPRIDADSLDLLGSAMNTKAVWQHKPCSDEDARHILQ